MQDSLRECDITKDKEARAFVEEVRLKQFASAQTLKGRSGLEPAQRLAIRATAVSYVVAGKPPQLTQSEMIRLLERFEEMARRQKFAINAGLRPAILGILLTELWVNKHALDSSVEKLIAATAYHGSVGLRLAKEFPQFSETPSLYRHAVMNYPSDPGSFIQKTQAAIEEMIREKEFEVFWDTPGLFRQAAIRNPSDPREFLRRVQNTMSAMAQEEEFAEFSNTPGIFKQAAISNPSDPREYVRKVQKEIREMREEEEFMDFHNTRGLFLQAVMRNPSDPRGFLRKIKKEISGIRQEEEFSEFHDKLHILQHAAVHNPSNPREFLRRSPKALWHAMLVKNLQSAKNVSRKREPSKKPNS